MIVLIQSGFPEINQMQVMKKYFKLLLSDLGYDYKGIILKGYGKSVEIMPMNFNKKWLNDIYNLGYFYGKKGKLESTLLTKINNPEKLPKPAIIFFKILKKTGVLDSYTSKKLKKNGITKIESYAKPLCINQ